MKVNEIKPGARIKCIFSGFEGRIATICPETGTGSSSFGGDGSFIKIEWDDGSKDYTQWLSATSFELLSSPKEVVSKAEGPCKSCSKQNDLGVQSCWWCGIAKPC